MRAQLINLFAGYKARIRIVYVEAPLREVLSRNKQRLLPVPQPVIYKLLDKLDMPDCTEAHRVDYAVEL